MSKTIPCPYCFTANPATRNMCLACGAPLAQKAPEPLDLTPKVTVVKPAPKPHPAPKPKKRPEEDLRKAGEKADQVYNAALYTYSVTWRTAAEAISIALVGLIIGMVGGATSMQVWGLLGAGLLGVAVGLTAKNFYMTLLSAPGGALLGLGLSAALWFVGASPKWLVFIVTVFAIAATVVGGRPRRQRRQNFWEKARPFLGGLGGLAFGIVGMLAGWGVATAIAELAQAP